MLLVIIGWLLFPRSLLSCSIEPESTTLMQTHSPGDLRQPPPKNHLKITSLFTSLCPTILQMLMSLLLTLLTQSARGSWLKPLSQLILVSFESLSLQADAVPESYISEDHLPVVPALSHSSLKGKQRADPSIQEASKN